jgi:hypothetical protein
MSSSSKRGRKIMSQAKEVHIGKCALALCITLWSDYFEPHSTKNNRGSVWSMMITIVAPNDNYHTTYNTYVVSIGKKGVDQTPVYDRVMVDLKELATYDQLNEYYSKAGGKVRVSAGLNTYLYDQPGKRSLTGTGASNANYSGQYGKSVQAKLIYKYLVRCRNCVIELHHENLPTNYNNCACWNTSSALLEIPPPRNYPKIRIPASNVLGPLTFDFPSIHLAIDIALDGLIYDNWKEIEAKNYLNRYSVHDKLVERVLGFVKETTSKYDDPNYEGSSESPPYHHFPN